MGARATDPLIGEMATLVELLRYRAAAQPARVAFTFLSNGEDEASTLTYQALDQQARAVAAQLQTIAEPGARALLLYPSGLEFVAAFFGCLYAGVIAVPAYPPHAKRPDPRVNAILHDAQATVALTTSAILDKMAAKLDLEADLAALHWIATDTLELAGATRWRSPQIDGDTLAFLQYTSGSTSTPKGVMITHANLMCNMADIANGWHHTQDSILVSWLPLFHDMGLIYGILTPVYRGFHSYFFDPVNFLQQPSRWLQAISRYGATHSGAPNFAYELCIDKTSPEQRQSLNLQSWQMALNGAEPVRLTTLQRFAELFAPHGFSARVFAPSYGLAEATVKVTTKRIENDFQVRLLQADALEQGRLVDATPATHNVRAIVGCGHSEVAADLRIVNPATLVECPPDQVGEIWVASPSVAKGYWQRPEATRATFQAYLADTQEGPYLRTGDLGFLQAGELFITGRSKDLLIIRGRNHYPQDIELTVEQSHAALRPSSGAAIEAEQAGEARLVIIQEVERTALRNLAEDQVISAIRHHVWQAHQLDCYAIALLKPGKIPKTSSGKIQRSACLAEFLAGSLDTISIWQAPASAPLAMPAQPTAAHVLPPNARLAPTAIRQWVINWLSQKQKIDASLIDLDRSFADFGLDSVTAVEMAQELETWLGWPLEPTILWNFATISALVQHLASQGAPSSTRQPMPDLKPTLSAQQLADRTDLALLDNLSEAELAELLAAELHGGQSENTS